VRESSAGPQRQGSYKVLFLCTGNSARSIMAEALLNYWGQARFRAFSAGSRPNEFAGAGAPKLDFVFTVCGNAAQEQCPYWPGQPMTAHWGIDDPAAAKGSKEQQARAFQRALRELDARIKLFVNLPFEKLDKMALQQQLREIGGSTTQA
jgi:arsenate reductase